MADEAVAVFSVGGMGKVLLLLIEGFFETDSRDRFLDASGSERP